MALHFTVTCPNYRAGLVRKSIKRLCDAEKLFSPYNALTLAIYFHLSSVCGNKNVTRWRLITLTTPPERKVWG